MQRFNIVVARPDGGVEVYPMKEWLRQHPQHIPPGLDPTSSTSHRLRNALKKRGWQVQDSPTEVRLILPGASGETAVDDVLGDPGEAITANEEAASFALEAQLRDFIVENLSRIPIDGRRLDLFSDSSGQSGVEYVTPIGRIDILAVDAEGSLLIFELKLERGPDRALGQLARYMGWVRAHLAQGRPVSGVIVASSIDERLRYAASVIPNVILLEYEIDFRVSQVAPIGADRDDVYAPVEGN